MRGRETGVLINRAVNCEVWVAPVAVNVMSVRRKGGFLLTGENRTTRIDSPRATLSKTNPTKTGLESNPCPLSEKSENRGTLLVDGFQGFFFKKILIFKKCNIITHKFLL